MTLVMLPPLIGLYARAIKDNGGMPSQASLRAISPDHESGRRAQEGDEILHVLDRKAVTASKRTNVAFAVAAVAFDSRCGAARTDFNFIRAKHRICPPSKSSGSSGGFLRVPVASHSRHGSFGNCSSVNCGFAHRLHRPLSISRCRASASAPLSRPLRPSPSL